MSGATQFIEMRLLRDNPVGLIATGLNLRLQTKYKNRKSNSE